MRSLACDVKLPARFRLMINLPKTVVKLLIFACQLVDSSLAPLDFNVNVLESL